MIKYIIRDIKGLKNKRPETGLILGFCSSKYSVFGSGKTLSMVRYITRLKEYRDHFYVVLTNIDINIKRDDVYFKHISSFNDICFYLEEFKKHYARNEYTVYICLDELACLMNSRDFQNNFTKDFLAKLVTCRHYNCNLIYTAQRFEMVDKNFRTLSLTTVLCKKFFWRFFLQKYYYSCDLERCDDSVLKPYAKRIYFRSDDICVYDTFANFKDFEKRQSSGLVDDIQIELPEISVSRAKATRRYRIAKHKNNNAV